MFNPIFAGNTLKVEYSGPEYWQRIQNGDKPAFEQVFRTYYQVLCNYACATVKDMDEAEEVVQQTFFNIWNKREDLEVRTSIKSYLYRAVHNECLNRIKHSKVRRMYAEDQKVFMAGGFEDSSKQLHGKELGALINRAIDSLPEQCRNVFRLSRFENMKYQEIADHLNISVKTVENHMGKALKLLRDQLKDYLPLLLFVFNIEQFLN